MYTFKKEERLCSKKLIDGLFSNGSSFLCYPYKISFLIIDATDTPAQVLFTVAKKRYKRAVDRNLLKRRIREAYRLHKQENLYRHLAAINKSLLLAIAYIGAEITDYQFIETKLLKGFSQLVIKI